MQSARGVHGIGDLIFFTLFPSESSNESHVINIAAARG